MRQFALWRLLTYGVEFGDATDSETWLGRGTPWKSTCVALADQLIARAEREDCLAHCRSDLMQRASAMLRVGISPMRTDTPDSAEIYERAARLFADSVTADHRAEEVLIDSSGGLVCG